MSIKQDIAIIDTSIAGRAATCPLLRPTVQCNGGNGVTEPITTVAILGADAAVGRILEQLVAGAGYASALLPDPLAEGFAETLAGAGLLLLAPAMSPESRDALLAGVSELGLDAPLVELPWPCGTEELKRMIEHAVNA